MFWWISLCKLISNYPSFLSPHRRGGIRQWLCTSLRTGRVRVVAFLLAWRFGSRSCLTLMAQVFLFLDVAAQVAFLHASKIPQRPNAVERSAVVLDAVLFQ